MTTTQLEVQPAVQTAVPGVPLDPLVLRRSEPTDDDARDRFVRAHARGTFFHLAGWRRAVEQSFHHRGCDLLAWRGAELCGVLPLMQCNGPFGGSHLISMPYAVYGGPLGNSHEVERELCAEAQRLAQRLQVGRLELRCLQDPGLDLLPSDRYATFIHALPEDPAEVMKRMPKRARAEVRKAVEKHGLELGQGLWYLGDLARLFHASKQHLGSPGLPIEWFASLAAEFGDDVVVHLARCGQEPLAATMSFVFRDTLLFYYIGTTEHANRTYNVTNYLCTRLQEWSVERGLRHFDLGRSRTDSGAFSFKVHQGFEPTPLNYRYALVKSDSLPSFTPSNPRTKFLRDTWARLPAWAATRLSARLARYLP